MVVLIITEFKCQSRVNKTAHQASIYGGTSELKDKARECDPPSPKNHFIKGHGWQEKGRDKELSVWDIVNVLLGSEGGLRAGH